LVTVLLTLLLLYLTLKGLKKLLRDTSGSGKAVTRLLQQFSQDHVALFC